jgi:hypothetical protein
MLGSSRQMNLTPVFCDLIGLPEWVVDGGNVTKLLPSGVRAAGGVEVHSKYH